MRRIKDAPELKAAFDKAYAECKHVKFEYPHEKNFAEHFFIAGRESLAEELETWRSPQSKPRRIELHLTIKNESDSSNPVALEQVYTL